VKDWWRSNPGGDRSYADLLGDRVGAGYRQSRSAISLRVRDGHDRARHIEQALAAARAASRELLMTRLSPRC
jgi:hypothetical protein